MDVASVRVLEEGAFQTTTDEESEAEEDQSVEPSHLKQAPPIKVMSIDEPSISASKVQSLPIPIPSSTTIQKGNYHLILCGVTFQSESSRSIS